MADVETGKNTIRGHSEGTLDPDKAATVTVTVRADAETRGPVTFRVTGPSSDYYPENNSATRDIVVAKTPAPVPPKPQPNPQPKLADTGASSAVPLLVGCVLLLLGGGLLVVVRRKRT